MHILSPAISNLQLNQRDVPLLSLLITTKLRQTLRFFYLPKNPNSNNSRRRANSRSIQLVFNGLATSMDVRMIGRTWGSQKD